MVSLSTITSFLNKELGVRKFKDSSRNGLQVKASKEIKKIAFAVDACLETFKAAKKQGCQLIVCHHGILWKGEKDPLKQKQQRINWLKKNNLSLYASHLPLDCHPVYGNNAVLSDFLHMTKRKKFGLYHSEYWGCHGKIQPTSLQAITKKLNSLLKTKCRVLAFGKKTIKNVGIVTGGASFAYIDTKKQNIDLLITGEPNHSDYHKIKEAGVNVIFGGHYATEVFGVKALQKLLKERFDVKTIFIDKPTNM